MSYPIFFSKTKNDDPTNPLYQDRITNDIWFTRLNNGGPLFNYKYYVDNSITPTINILSADFWYNEPNSQGGTIGVKWAILSSTGFLDLSASGINPALFGTIGNPTNFFSFSQMCTLLRAMIEETSKPISLVNANNDNEWVLEDSSIVGGTEMPYLENKDLGCYIPALNKYFKINITLWGIGGNNNQGTISYTRTELYNQIISQNKNNYNFGLFVRGKGGNHKIAAATINLGCTKGRGSSTRIFNYCNKRENYGFCLNQFVTYR